jgi:hypothetical protein
MKNFCKYFSSTTVVFTSYLTNHINNEYVTYWILCAIICTIYSYLWDIYKDWGLMNKKYAYLREILIY